MMAQVEYFTKTGKYIEAQRLKERVEYDMEMIRELGYCNGIENYSRFFRPAQTRYPTFLFAGLFSERLSDGDR